MAGNFQGWLLKFGTVQLPNSFLLIDGFESTPNQRMEIDAYRDANALLHRETSNNFKTILKITVRELTLEEKIAFQNVINQAMVVPIERKINLTYWNDELNNYVTSPTGFYIPDIDFKIHRVDEVKKDIEYESFTVSMTEY